MHPCVPKSRAPHLTHAFAVAAKILHERIEPAHRLVLRPHAKGRQPLPFSTSARAQKGRVRSLPHAIRLRHRPDREMIRLSDVPVEIHHALAACAFTAKALDPRARSFK